MELTKRQAIFLILICLVANKVQRLPSLISTNVGRHGWLAFLIMGVIDICFLFVALAFNKKAKNKTTYEICKNAGGGGFAKIMVFLMFIYFMASSLLPYEAVHDLFANILFDHLSWEIYSVMLALAVFFIASRGLKNIGRLGEIYFYIIGVSFIILLTLGAFTTNYYHVLPLGDVRWESMVKTCVEYNLWFGDYLLIYMFVGKIKEDNKPLGWSCVIPFIIVVLLISFAYMVFYGLYEILSINQNSLISAISQFSLLEFDVGRIDWFFVLFFQISAVVSSATYLFSAAECVREIFNLKSINASCFILTIVIYLLDVFVFKSVQAGAGAIASVSKYFALFMIIGFPLIMYICVVVANRKNKSKIKKLPKQYNRLFELNKKSDRNNFVNKFKVGDNYEEVN